MAKNDDFNPWISKYRDEMCEEIIEMFKKGKTKAHFCATHGLGSETFSKWRRKYERFDNAVIFAEQCARQYYDTMRDKYLEAEDGMATTDEEGNIVVKKLNWAVFNKMYSARFNIPDKRTVKVKGLGKSKDEREMLKCLSIAVEEEELTPDEASKLLGIVETSLKVKQTNELEDRLTLLEKELK